LAALDLHSDGTVRRLQAVLRRNVALFAGWGGNDDGLFSPIQMIDLGCVENAIAAGERLLDRGYFVPATFFPTVPLQHSQLRICVTATHTPEQLSGLRDAIAEISDPRGG
jgi:7-keto-8-aminopelargonate synthetase-like enzyme